MKLQMGNRTLRILVSDPLSQHGLNMLASEQDFEVDVKTDLTPDELIERIGDYDALIVRSRTQVSASVIDAAERLQVIGRAGVGVDNIDLQAATDQGILVVNAPASCTIAVAEQTLALLLALSRNMLPAATALKRGEWIRSTFLGVELYGKVLGVIGLGRIGTEVIRRAKVFGMQTIGFDPYISDSAAQKMGIHLVKREDLFRRADYICIHVPFSPETHHSIGDYEFSLMKPGCRLINCARGGIVDEAALLRALKNGKIAGAAIDVFETEPPIDHPLLKLDNVLATPHLGACTIEAQTHVAEEIVRQVTQALRGLPVTNAVNHPKRDLRNQKGIEPYLMSKAQVRRREDRRLSI